MIKQSTFISHQDRNIEVRLSCICVGDAVNGNKEKQMRNKQVEDSGAICIAPVSFGFMLSKLTFQRSRVMLLFFTRSADSH